MYREHRHPYDDVPRRPIYKRLGPPPLPPLVDYAEGRLGPTPQRVAQPQSDYPTPCIPTMYASCAVCVCVCVCGVCVCVCVCVVWCVSVRACVWSL